MTFHPQPDVLFFCADGAREVRRTRVSITERTNGPFCENKGSDSADVQRFCNWGEVFELFKCRLPASMQLQLAPRMGSCFPWALLNDWCSCSFGCYNGTETVAAMG